MINKRTLLAAILTTSVLVAVPAITYAEGNCNRGYDNKHSQQEKGMHQRGHSKGHHKGGKQGVMGSERMTKKLDLTDEQQAEIKAIRDSNQEVSTSLRERMVESRQALGALDTTSADYDAEVETIASTIAELEKEKIVNRSNVRKQIALVLTDEQNAQMAEMKGKMGKRAGKNSQ